MPFSGKSIWIHDASNALPAAMALELAQMGNHLLVSGRDEVAIQRLVDQSGGAIHGFPLDISVSANREKAVARLSVMTDKLDIAICYGGPTADMDLHSLNTRTMEQLTARLFTDAVHFVAMASPLQQQVPRPRLLIINPMQHLAPNRRDAFRAPEAALEQFTRALARDAKYRQFSVNLMLVNTPLTARLAPGSNVANLTRQIISAMEQSRFPIRVPAKRGSLGQLLAWRPKDWYRSRIGYAPPQKGTFH